MTHEDILAAYDPKLARKFFEICAEQAEDFLAGCGESDFVNGESPEALRAIIRSMLSQDVQTESKVDRFDKVLRQIIKFSANLHAPRYMGHQVPPPIPAAAAVEGVIGLLNQGLAVAEMSPFASAAERVVAEKLCAQIGWKPDLSTGVATSGGTLANMTAILAARNRAWPNFWRQGAPTGVKAAILTSREAHYSIARSAGVLGLGTDNVIAAAINERRRMTRDTVRAALTNAKEKGHSVFCVIASAPSTPIGAIDHLREIGELCREEQIWFHVDAVHGAPFLFSAALRSKLDGIELADSVAWDAHKMMHVPSLCTFLLYQRREDSFLPFENRASYLFDENQCGDGLLDLGKRTFECTKRAITIPVMLLWAVYGAEFFGKLADGLMVETCGFFEQLARYSEFDLPFKPDTNIIVFRHIPESVRGLPVEEQNRLQKALRVALHREGKFYVTQAHIEDKDYLRLTIINPRTTTEHVTDLIETLRRLGRFST